MAEKADIPTLSKSRFLAGLQCPLRLWHQCYNRDLASEISPDQQAIFDTGNQIGELATRLYPGGVLVGEDHFHHREAVETTLRLMEDPAVPAIYEAAYLSDAVRIRVDILERIGSHKWNLVEIKSSSSVKDVYLPDVAVQFYVLRKAGLNISRAFLMHVNNQYIYDGSHLDLSAFFSISDLTDQILPFKGIIHKRLAEMKTMLGNPEPPAVEPSRHCHNPYTCEFWEHCTQDTPKHWIMEMFRLNQGKLNELAAIHVKDIRDIPESFPMTEIQERIRRCAINNTVHISPELELELADVEYPVHFLDFETIAPTIPRYPGTHPFQTIPFQWSDHILHEDGTLDHLEYLCMEDKDPREAFARTLLKALGNKGSIFIYTPYEKRIINDLADYLPLFRHEVPEIMDRFKDLHAIIQKHFYHPEFHGSFSLKYVLPALIPEMDYANLSIQDGTQATMEYLNMIDPLTPPQEKDRIRQGLLTYCGQDTLAMVRLRESLLSRFST